MNISYRIVSPELVEVHNRGHVFWATKQGALDAMKNIERQRADYVTEDAYNRELDVYRGAVRALDDDEELEELESLRDVLASYQAEIEDWEGGEEATDIDLDQLQEDLK